MVDESEQKKRLLSELASKLHEKYADSEKDIYKIKREEENEPSEVEPETLAAKPEEKLEVKEEPVQVVVSSDTDSVSVNVTKEETIDKPKSSDAPAEPPKAAEFPAEPALPKDFQKEEKPIIPEKPFTPVKASPIDFIKEHKKIFIIGASALALLIITFVIILPLLTAPKYTLDMQVGDAGQSFEALFNTNQDLSDVTFVFTHSSGYTQEFDASKQGSEWISSIILPRSGEWTLEVKSGQNTYYTQSLSIASSCTADAECDSLCCYGACSEPTCLADSECADEDACTTETCSNPGTCESACAYTRETLFLTGDNCCPRGATRDNDPDCTNCPTGKLFCSGACITIVCSRNADCNDNNFATQDICYDGGTCSARCENTAGGCLEGQILCSNRCTTPVCKTNADCNDNNTLTNDTCLNPNTCTASCSYTGGSCTSNTNCQAGMICCSNVCKKPACSIYTECEDNNPSTSDLCNNPNTCTAACSNTACTIACSSDASCGAGKKCFNPGTCSSKCAECQIDSDCTSGKLCCSGLCKTISCYSNADCSFGQTCYNPGTCSGSCGTSSCSSNADCLSGKICCGSTCTTLSCGQQYWTNIGINRTLMVGGNNVSNIYLTLNNTVDNSVLVKIYNSTTNFVNNERKTLPYSYNSPSSGFNVTIHSYNPEINNASITWALYCPPNKHCINYNTCSSACADCTQDLHCEAGKICSASNTCVTPACNYTLTKIGDLLIDHCTQGSYIYCKLTNNTVFYYNGFVTYLPSISSKTIQTIHFDNYLYALTTAGDIYKYDSSWSLVSSSGILYEGIPSALYVDNNNFYVGTNNGEVLMYDSETELTQNWQVGVNVNSIITFLEQPFVISYVAGKLQLYYYGEEGWTQLLVPEYFPSDPSRHGQHIFDTKVIGSELFISNKESDSHAIVQKTSDLESFQNVSTDIFYQYIEGSSNKLFMTTGTYDDYVKVYYSGSVNTIINNAAEYTFYAGTYLNEHYLFDYYMDGTMKGRFFKYAPVNCNGLCINYGTNSAYCLQ